MNNLNLIGLLGQTSSGKSDIAVDLAIELTKNCNKSCIISCDSRQVYKNLNIATGKVQGGWKNGEFVYREVVHYLLDFVDPKTEYNLANFVKNFYDTITKIQNEKKFETIILTGGTGLYARAILEKIDLGEVLPQFEQEYLNHKKDLQRLSLGELQTMVDQKNTKLNNSDYHNPRRLESNLLRHFATANNWLIPNQYHNFKTQICFAIDINQQDLHQKIASRLTNRLNDGLLNEVLEYSYLGKNRFWNLGLEYKQGWLYLNGGQTKEEFEANLLQENLHYAKRQLTWLKKQKNLTWIRNLEDILDKLKNITKS